MENKQKIWLAVSLLIFLIPEILWFNGIRGNVDIPWMPIETFEQFGNILLASFTTIVPFAGLAVATRIVAKLKINKKFKITFFLFSIPLLCWTGFIALMFIWVMAYYFSGVPQIG